MNSETITRNDLAAILNEVLPPTASEYRTLLWTNPNPTANFNASTILSNTNLTKYDEVEVEWLYNNSSITTNGSRKRITVGNGSILQSVGGTAGSGSGAITIVTRTCTVNTNNIVFGDAYLGYDGQAMSNGFNHNLIPYKIYGIQYDRTALPIEINTYSTTEQVIGTWIDGKPIYRKVYIPFEAKSYASGSYTVTLDVPIGKIIRWDVLTTGNNNENQEVNKYIVPGRYSKTPNQISLDCNTSNYNTNITHIILEYTKSTD